MFDNIREWISDNLRYILLGLAALLVVVMVVCIVRLTRGGSSSDGAGTANTQEASQNQGQDDADTSDEAATEGTAAPVSTAKTGLVKDDAAVLALVEQYYTAVAAADTATLSTIVEPWNTEVQQNTLTDVIESYNNISTYSKPGLDAGSFVVFTYYEAKMSNIDTLAPTLVAMYVRADDDGTLTIYPFRDNDTDVENYVTEVSADSDVQDLIAEVQAQFNTAVGSDEALKQYTDTLRETTTAEDGSDSVAAGGQMQTTTTLNIRQTASTDAAIMGVVLEGTVVNVIADAGDGWVQISYDSGSGTIEGYLKSEYLTAVSGGETTADDATSTTAQGGV